MGVPPSEATTDQVACALYNCFNFYKAKPEMHAVLIHGFSGLSFHTMLAPNSRLWIQNLEKHGAFLDPLSIVLWMAKARFPSDICTLRVHCVCIACRLHNSFGAAEYSVYSDMGRIRHRTSVLGRTSTIKIRRKGQYSKRELSHYPSVHRSVHLNS